MTEKERIELKQKIVESISSTRKDIAELEELTKPISPENAIGRISRMDAINNKSINDAALVQTRLKMEKLVLATEKCDDSEFGICRKCHGAIPMGRLLLMPESFYCVRCASSR
ncbi:MAG: DnaK suppressor protein [Bacteroidia bacterium]|jgi:DnaK suppressor protein